jgi:nitrate reductase (cytochrome)
VVGIQGDQLAEVNKGLLCVKGYHVGLALYGQDRLTTPLLRRNGNLEPITWEEALDVFAQRVMAAPDRFAFYGSGQWTIPEGYAAQKFMKGGLSNNHIEPNARLCMASAVTGYLSTYGVDEPAGCYDDLDACDVLILWGNNMAEMHPVLFSRVIDRRTRGRGGHHHRPRHAPHSQHRILPTLPRIPPAHRPRHRKRHRPPTHQEQHAMTHSSCKRFCNFRRNTQKPNTRGRAMTFRGVQATASPNIPPNSSARSPVCPPNKSDLLGELFAAIPSGITSVWCMGFNQHSRGTDINRLVHGIHLLSGHFGKPGDAPTSLTGQPSACGTAREVGTLCHFLPGGRLVANAEHRAETEKLWNLPPGRINPHPAITR